MGKKRNWKEKMKKMWLTPAGKESPKGGMRQNWR
jgi:hypothetical protein